jgi:hypothetical protein
MELENKYKSEKLPSGLYTWRNMFVEDHFIVQNSFTSEMVSLSLLDVRRLYGIAHPTKVHGSCTIKPKEDEG